MHPKLLKARTQMLLKEPFYGTVAMAFKIIEDPTCLTMWVDGVNLGYNPEYLESISMPEAIGVLAHETFHVVSGHCWRGAGREHDLWNDAADYADNPHVLESGFILPDGALIDSRFNGLAAEQIYRILKSESPDKNNRSSPSSKNEGVGDDSKTGDGDSSSDEIETRRSGGRTRQPGEVRQYEGHDRSEQLAKSKDNVAHAAQIAKAQGALSGDLERLVRIALAPRVDWVSVLQRFMQSLTPSDYSYRRPNPCYIFDDLYLPTLGVPRLGTIVFVRDSSGSVDMDTQAAFAAEIHAVYHEMRPERLIVIDCDCTVTQVQEFEAADDLTLGSLKGGGGTSFIPPFEWIAQEGIDPVALVYLTDMQGRFPVEGPPYEVLWATVTHPCRLRSTPSFGELVHVDV